MSKLMSGVLLGASLVFTGLAAKCFNEFIVEKSREKENITLSGEKYEGRKPLFDSGAYFVLAGAASFAAFVTGAGSVIYYKKKE